MKLINVATGEGIKKTLFPDGQPHIQVLDICEGDEVNVIAPLRSSLEVLQLLMVANAVANAGGELLDLHVPYLMGARYDRPMQPGDSFDLEVIANLVNSTCFDRIVLYDVHSPVALRKISKSINIDNRQLVQLYDRADAVLIIPDKGAYEKAQKYAGWNPRLTSAVHCEKVRDIEGRVTLKVLEPERCVGRNCVVVDDICDGGATFNAIAGQIQPAHLTLIVTHGIFSKGFDKLRENFNEIITTDSFELGRKERGVRFVPLNIHL